MAGHKDKILSVRGELDPSELGVTLTHEHLIARVPSFYTPAKAHVNHLEESPWDLRHLGWIRQNPYSHISNLSMHGEFDAIQEELEFYKKNGGSSIVENSTVGLFPDLAGLKHLSDVTGVNIISGTGFYVDAAQTESVKSTSEEQMAQKMRTDILEGEQGIRCGIIGEIGTTWPITDFEKRSLRSSAVVQDELGCPVIIHPGRHTEAPGEVMRIFQEAGGKAGHTVMSHLDRTLFEHGDLFEFAKVGTYLEYDLFGIEVSYYQIVEALDMPSDAQRIKYVKALLDEGYGDRLLLSHDIHTKHRMMKYGGHGYSHVLVNVVPKMLQRGITQQQVDTMLKENPRRWLQFFK